MKIYFDHERLQAYQSSLDFIRWSEPVLDRLPKAAAIYSQLDRARISVPLNIAEGNAKYTPADKCKCFDNAHGSAVECASCLDVLFLKLALGAAELDEGKAILCGVVRLLVGLINSKSPDRLRESAAEYQIVGSGDGREKSKSGSRGKSGSKSRSKSRSKSNK